MVISTAHRFTHHIRAGGLVLLVLAGGAGCYGGVRATRDVSAAWVGRTRGDLEDRWGSPADVGELGGETVLHWSHLRHDFKLPEVEIRDLTLREGHYGATVVLRPGATWSTSTDVLAFVGPDGTIKRVVGPSPKWGGPNDVNLRWGFLLGMHVGMGRLDDTRKPLPSGGLYMGGMLARDVALVGCFALSSGRDRDGGAMGFAWGVAAQWWPLTRVWLRAGPALVLDLDPGFKSPAFSPGLTTGASFAFLKSGSLVLDLRADATVSPSAWLGSVGVGVNLN